MLDAIYLYSRYATISMRGQMQYRASFILQTFGQFIGNFAEFLAILVLFNHFDTIHGWTLPEVALLYGMVHSAFAVCDAMSRGFDLFAPTIKGGDFDRILLRPRTAWLQLAGQEVTLKRLGRILQGMAVFVYAVVALDIGWSVPKVGLLAFAFVGTYCFFYGLLMVQATWCFWTIEGLEAMNAFTYGGVFMAQYPFQIYARWFRRVFTFILPLGACVYVPATAILDKPLPGPAWFPWVAPGLGILFFAFSFLVWGFGVRHYQSTGS